MAGEALLNASLDDAALQQWDVLAPCDALPSAIWRNTGEGHWKVLKQKVNSSSDTNATLFEINLLPLVPLAPLFGKQLSQDDCRRA